MAWQIWILQFWWCSFTSKWFHLLFEVPNLENYLSQFRKITSPIALKIHCTNLFFWLSQKNDWPTHFLIDRLLYPLFQRPKPVIFIIRRFRNVSEVNQLIKNTRITWNFSICYAMNRNTQHILLRSHILCVFSQRTYYAANDLCTLRL